MKKIFNCIMIIIGTFVGAGFASGQEVASFFNRFENKGLIGIIIASLFFGIIIYKVLNSKTIEKYEDIINKNKFILNIVKTFTFICFCIMISGVGSYIEQQFNISFWFGAIFVSAICFVSFIFKFNGLEKINNFLVPIILFGVILIGINNYNVDAVSVVSDVTSKNFLNNNWLISAILYVGYNSIILIPILIELKNYNLNKKDITFLCIVTSLIIGIMLLFIYRVLNIFYPGIMFNEIPLLEIAKTCNKFIMYYYGTVILFAIFTTAFSTGYAFLKLNSETHYFRNAFLMCVFGTIFAKIGFSHLINLFFPIFGYMGILQIIKIFIL